MRIPGTPNSPSDLNMDRFVQAQKTTEQRLRESERAALGGGPVERATWMRYREREGLLSRKKIKLAAFCGDAGAREVVGWTECDCGDLPREPILAVCSDCSLIEFLDQIENRGVKVAVRASIAASRVLLLRYESAHSLRVHSQGYRERRTIEAAEEWLKCPCDKHLVDWARVNARAPDWTPCPVGIDMAGMAVANIEGVRRFLDPDIEIIPDQLLRDAICAALIKWALSE